MKKLVCVLSMTLFLGACSSTMQQSPVGIGSGVNDLKRSPCACAEIPMNMERFTQQYNIS